MKKSNILKFIIIIIFLSLFFYIIVSIIKVQSIKKNPGFTEAIIIGYKQNRGAYALQYQYYVDGLKYVNLDGNYYYTPFELFKNKKLHCLYNKNKPKQSFLLRNSKMYKQYGFIIPDSLKFLEDCR